jgi:aspartate carbamoyltransferase catalytic subunit
MHVEECTESLHLLDTIYLHKTEMEQILQRALYWEEHRMHSDAPFAGRFVANLFFEASSRTRFSFEVAEKKLGLHVLNFQVASSSMNKGESMEDTVKMLACLGVEVVVIRHREPEVIWELAQKNTGCVIINAGAGKRAHPTQALLDLYTIKKYFADLTGITVAMIGDIAHSRVVRSNLSTLQAFGAHVVVSGPESMRDADIEKRATYVPFVEAIRQADVVMMLRVQLERHNQHLFSSAADYCRHYGLTLERLHQMKPHAILLHPAPFHRGVEIADACIEHPRSKIFEQMKNGVFVRMAVLERALGGGKR